MQTIGKSTGNYKGPPTLSQNFMNVGPQTAKTRTFIFPIVHKSYIQLLCQPLLINVSKCESTKVCQMAEANQALKCRTNFGVLTKTRGG